MTSRLKWPSSRRLACTEIDTNILYKDTQAHSLVPPPTQRAASCLHVKGISESNRVPFPITYLIPIAAALKHKRDRMASGDSPKASGDSPKADATMRQRRARRPESPEGGVTAAMELRAAAAALQRAHHKSDCLLPKRRRVH